MIRVTVVKSVRWCVIPTTVLLDCIPQYGGASVPPTCLQCVNLLFLNWWRLVAFQLTKPIDRILDREPMREGCVDYKSDS